jgi:hypothetical protein
MGWAVAWNCIANTYVIQNPPGAVNWAIGCIGKRITEARYFDKAPILPEGIFGSHGKPVAPQSLYLAQLSERLGQQALTSLGYESNSLKEFPDKSTPRLPQLRSDVDANLGPNLALRRPINTSNVRNDNREFGGEKAVDGDENTYWATNDDARRMTLEVDMEGPVEVNGMDIGEAIGMEGGVLEYKVEGEVDSDWKLLAQGTEIGPRVIARFPEETVWKVRLTIVKSNAYPAIRRFGLYHVP